MSFTYSRQTKKSSLMDGVELHINMTLTRPLSLDGFFSNEIPYLVSSLRKRLEDMFPSGVDEDRKYIRCWERARSANDKSADEETTDEELFDSFDEYCKGVRGACQFT